MKTRRDRRNKKTMFQIPLVKKYPALTKVGMVTMLSGTLMSHQAQAFANESHESATITINAIDYDNLSDVDRARIIHSSISENIDVNTEAVRYTLVYRKNGTCDLHSHGKTGISLGDLSTTKTQSELNNLKKQGGTLPNTGSETSFGLVMFGGVLLASAAYLVLKNKKTGKLLLVAVVGLGLASQPVSAETILETVSSLDATLTYDVKSGELFSFTPLGTIDCYEYVGYIPVSVTAKGTSLVQGEKPELELPKEEVPAVESPEIKIETKVPNNAPVVEEKPTLEIEITKVPEDYPTVELPELDISVVPGDYPTVELPELDISVVPGDYPTVELPELDISIVPSDYPIHEKPELNIDLPNPSVEEPPTEPKRRRKFVFADFDDRTKQYYKEAGLTLPVIEFDEYGDDEPNLQDIVLETNNPVSFSEYMAKNYPSIDFGGTTKPYDDGRYFVPAWDDEGFITLPKLELIKTEKVDENGEPFIEYRYEPMFESFVVYPE